MLMRSPAHPRSARAPWRLDDWRQVSALRVVIPAILAAVSAYYLIAWAGANAMPPWLAWTLPAALDVTAFGAVKVAQHPRDAAAKWKASALAWLCVALSVAGNIGAHALALGILRPNFWTIAATAAVYPLMLAAGHIVAGGMAARPLSAAQQAAAEAERIAADARVRAAQQAVRASGRRAPARPPTQANRPAPTRVPAPVRAAPTRPAPADDVLHERAVAVLRSPAGWGRGRRVLIDALGVTDNAAKRLHPAAAARARELGPLEPAAA